MSSPPETRLEIDSLGAVEVPAGALYGVHTVRAVANFGVSSATMADEVELVAALAYVKAAAARANLARGSPVGRGGLRHRRGGARGGDRARIDASSRSTCCTEAAGPRST